MDLLEHQAILGRLQRKHRKAQEEAAALRAQVEEFKSTPPRPDFSSSPPKPAYGRRICVGSCCTRLDAGFSGGWAYDGASPLNSPATGGVPAPPPQRGGFLGGRGGQPSEAREGGGEKGEAGGEDPAGLCPVCLRVGQENRRPRSTSRCAGLLDRDRNPKRRAGPPVGQTATVPRRGRYPMHLSYSIYIHIQPYPHAHTNTMYPYVF